MMIQQMERLLGKRIQRTYEPMRRGDQVYFVADTRRLADRTGWQARVSWTDGLVDLVEWLRESHPVSHDRKWMATA
jgi:CDP-paratose 2-epimerase